MENGKRGAKLKLSDSKKQNSEIKLMCVCVCVSVSACVCVAISPCKRHGNATCTRLGNTADGPRARTKTKIKPSNKRGSIERSGRTRFGFHGESPARPPAVPPPLPATKWWICAVLAQRRRHGIRYGQLRPTWS